MGKRTSGERKVIYYSDELNDEFSEAQITPRVVDSNFRYFHGKLWDLCSLAVQNVFSMPIKYLYAKLKFHIRFVGREKLKTYRNSGYFIYGNHTQPFADTFIPSLGNYPKRNFFIVNPENISMPGLGKLVEMLGAIPIPCDLGGMKHFMEAVEDKIGRNDSVTIYPEAHIWPYYIGIRPFKAVSFRYPVKLKCPVFALTNTYHRRGKKGEKVQIVTYIDGPFFADESLDPREARQKLRDRVYQCMVERSKSSDYEYIRYRRKEET
ncbi:MAG: 1-acyl-sn-glycerol-3-phosphate acyltransferase [Eubacterium sp.]|nr:1-acyl-sn-glycerol-3-phosphate acyltransferase [Eubacterium sp.]MCM1216392.1 1-acyl-sn-glycerol-3-phosphate acyltransferase [Lachnospiraceae bacterium]MCM1303440.1 1-acyl-sn-glycerol-3-phosphate acyltransferase [Butyrivibrio sp.]MCM1343680.1 1-acyl-sn-glycerol-3-phosphate acyltransferase [Muribaculaceae bacterium]MCM1238242.1 1-acyl-sn-glycerol-3-phosphate acyltransferase [Lachnospiraceae bacterium]